MCRELRSAPDRYEDEKAKAGALDFLDLLLKARDLVRDDADVRRSFQQRFKRIFVDEFQDTDPLQAEILLLLAADDPSVSNWREVRPVPGKLFIVGDPKQSIYRFRRADVSIYRDVYDMLEAAGAKRVTLRTSFRARPNIQRAINAAFEPVMTTNAEAPIPQSDRPATCPGTIPSGSAGAAVRRRAAGARPYGIQRIANTSIEKSLPDAVGAYVDWLINKSGWKVRNDRNGRTVIGSARLQPPWTMLERPRSVSNPASENTWFQSRRGTSVCCFAASPATAKT